MQLVGFFNEGCNTSQSLLTEHTHGILLVFGSVLPRSNLNKNLQLDIGGFLPTKSCVTPQRYHGLIA